MAVSFFAAPAMAGGTSPCDLVALGDGRGFPVGVLLQIARRGRALPGRPFQSVHLVAAATCCAARIASHSVGATTPTRLPLTTTCAFGKSGFVQLRRRRPASSRASSDAPCARAACRAAARRWPTVSLAVTLEAVTVFLKDLPMTVYWLTGFMGGLPVDRQVP